MKAEPSFDPSDIIGKPELTARLQMGPNYVYNLTKRSRRRSGDTIPHFKVGRYLRFRWSEVCKWLESQRAKVGKGA